LYCSWGSRIAAVFLGYSYALDMRRRTSLAAVAIAAALTFALAGCFSASPSAPTATNSAPPTTTVEGGTGELIAGTGYTLIAPVEWVFPPDAPPVADIYLIDEDPNANGFVNTLSVIVGPATGETPAELETNGVAYLKDVVGETEVHVRPRVTIAGSESVHISAQMSMTGRLYWLEQYILTDAGVAYIITFSLRQAISQINREALAESVLATWTWAPTSFAGYYEDVDADYAITFPGKPFVAVTASGGTRASYSTAPDPAAPDAVFYTARGTTATGEEIVSDTLEFVFIQLIDTGAVLTGAGESFELEGMPALMSSFTDPAGKPATMLVAGEGHSLYQLIVVGGTTEERQAFFDSFMLLG
jgi:hypothetical protein